MPRLVPLLTLLLCLPLSAAASVRAPSMPPWGTGESRGEDLLISLATFGPGDDVPSWFGHASLVVEDQRLGRQRLYNYGMFSFDERMLMRFAMGRLEFWVADASPGATYRFYRSLDREVRIQELNLTHAQRLELARMLAENVLPENRDYLYHHYNDNCATRLRDGLDRAVGGQLRQDTSGPARMTLRDHTRRYSAVNPPMSVLLDFLMNDEIDKPITRWDEAFLPLELERQVAAMQVVGEDGQRRPLVAKSWSYHEAVSRAPIPEAPPVYEPVLLALGLALGGGALGLSLWGRRGGRAPRILLGLENVLAGLVLGIPGLALFIMAVVTDHTVTYRNENLFLANPLTLLALPLGIQLMRGSARASERLKWLWWVLAGSGALGVALKVLPLFDQDNWRLIALILPISLGMAGAFVLARAWAPGVGRAPEGEALASTLKF